jgi:hypothetical protein
VGVRFEVRMKDRIVIDGVEEQKRWRLMLAAWRHEDNSS